MPWIGQLVSALAPKTTPKPCGSHAFRDHRVFTGLVMPATWHPIPPTAPSDHTSYTVRWDLPVPKTQPLALASGVHPSQDPPSGRTGVEPGHFKLYPGHFKLTG